MKPKEKHIFRLMEPVGMKQMSRNSESIWTDEAELQLLICLY
jgi:hypothetical protein